MKKNMFEGLIVLVTVIMLSSFGLAAQQKGKPDAAPSKGTAQTIPAAAPRNIQSAPDLLVERIWLDSACLVRFRLKNTGPGGIADTQHAQGEVRVTVGDKTMLFFFSRGTPIGQPPVDGAGALKRPGGSVEYNTGIRLEKASMVSVIVDQDRKIAETNDRNNQLMSMLTPQCPGQKQMVQEIGQAQTVKKEAKIIDPHQAKAQALERTRQMAARRKAVVKQKRDQELRMLNSRAMTRIQTLKSSPTKLALAKSAEGSDLTATMPKMTSAAGRPTSPVSLDSATPQPVAPGQDLTILGNGFGTRQGRVSINVEGMWISLSIKSWRESYVTVTIPAALAEVVGSREKNARIEIHHAEWGAATMTVRLSPDESRITPEITSLSERTIRPGQIFFIDGRNFFSRGGTVRLNLVTSRGASLGTTLDGIVDHWDDTVIAAHFREDLEGFQWDSIFSVEVENRESRRSNTKTVILDPNVDTDVLTDIKEFTTIEGHLCNSWEAHRTTRTMGTFEGVHLLNGWRLDTSELVPGPTGYGDPSTCVYTIGPPREHSEYPGVAINVSNPEGDCWASCTHTVGIEGPRGFSYK